MISIEINGIDFRHFNAANVQWRFDSIASPFSFQLIFDPENELHREIFMPGSYLRAIVKYNNRPIITGVILHYVFKASATKHLVQVSGYSISGVLEDCEMPQDLYPLQVNGLNLVQVTERIAEKFGLTVALDIPSGSDLATRLMKRYDKVTASDNQTCTSFLGELANQRQVILSHDRYGNIVLTESKTKSEPVYHFEDNAPGIEFNLEFNGQRMHDTVSMIRQVSKKNTQGGQAEVSNPFVKAYRPTVKRQSAGDNQEDTRTAARNALSEELKAITLDIVMQGWNLGDRIIEPNSIIAVTNPELYLFGKTRWFVESVNFEGNSQEHRASLKCYLPEVYNEDEPQNIFEQ